MVDLNLVRTQGIPFLKASACRVNMGSVTKSELLIGILLESTRVTSGAGIYIYSIYMVSYKGIYIFVKKEVGALLTKECHLVAGREWFASMAKCTRSSK